MVTNENNAEEIPMAMPLKQPARGRKKAIAKVIAEKCTGCKICVAVCKSQSIRIVESDYNFNGVAQIDPNCTGCNICAIDCPWDAIVMEYPDGTQKTMAEYERQLKKLKGYQ